MGSSEEQEEEQREGEKDEEYDGDSDDVDDDDEECIPVAMVLRVVVRDCVGEYVIFFIHE